MNDVKFIRWGNLNPARHKEERKKKYNDEFHSAPMYKGIYAFPTNKVEPFLLGGVFGDNRNHLLKDDEGNKVLSNDLWDDKGQIKSIYKRLLKKKKIRTQDLSSIYDEEKETWYVSYMPKPHIFEYKGLIWHHLVNCVNRKDILDEKGSWIQTTYEVYCEALNRADKKERFDSYMLISKGYRRGNPHTCKNFFSKDHYEVFIEKID